MPGTPSSVDVMRQLDRILSGAHFKNAPRLAAFLRFTVETTLAGRAHDLKEWSIGVAVFERLESYSPQEDPIVRIMAGRVRAKLAEHYQGSGPNDPVLIELPRGAYVPHWSWRQPAKAMEPQAAFQKPRSLSVGRQGEAEHLADAFRAACAGSGCLVTICGDAGMGKTTLAEEFLASVEAGASAAVTIGRCSERLADSDAFAPILEALDGLARGQLGAQASALMQAVAPAWHKLVVPGSGDTGIQVASRERIQREFAAFVEKLSAASPLVLVLDDVHWADASTCDLLARLAPRIRDLRVLVIATYRPGEMLVGTQPFVGLKLAFQKRNACRELSLPFLTRDDVARFIDLRWPGHRLPAEFAGIVYERTEGNPLFLNDLLSYLADTQVVAQRDGHGELTQPLAAVRGVVPAGTHAMIGVKIGQLEDEDRSILRCGAVQGVEFDSAIVARVLALDPVTVEERLRQLEQIHRIVSMVEESDRPGLPLSVRYGFVHVFYQNALYASLTPSRRVAESLAVAGALSSGGPAAVQAMAGELAVLYEIGREYGLAAQHFLQAARNAARVFAYPETVLLVERGLSALATLPESPERDGQELLFSLTLGMALMSTRGYAAPEVERTHRRSRELCIKQREVRRLIPVLWGIHTCETNGGRLLEALSTAHEMREAAEVLGQRESRVTSLHALGTTLAFMGRLTEAKEALDQILVLAPPEQHEFRGSLYVLDPLVTSLSMLGRLLTLMGEGESARARATESVALASRLAHPHSLAYATFWTGWILEFQGWHAASLEPLESAMELGRTHGFPLIAEWARVVRGSALVHLDRCAEALAEIRKSIERQDAMGSKLERAYCLTVLAEALLRNGQAAEAIEKCGEALELSQRTGGKNYDPETLRLRGEALLALCGPSRRTEAEADFLRAIQEARECRCTLLELRAAMSYHRCQSAAGDRAAARLHLERAAASFRPIEAPLAAEARRQLGPTP